MKKFAINVEVIRSYVVEVEADNFQDAVNKVEDMDIDEIELDNNYIDTHILVDDEPDLVDD
jgi:hypothetical protein